jgi:hypothetical protein
VLELHEDKEGLVMSPIVAGLALTYCRARQRCFIKAKPRSPW